MPIRTVSWNLYHGRDFPPDPALLTWRSRLLGRTERSETHLQVNRDLLGEFVEVLDAAEWDLALLQECPPRWTASLARACRAQAHRTLTSRNSLAPLRAAVARLNPDLIASNEGGSNSTLVRGVAIAERRDLVLRPGPRPERRAMAFTRLASGPCVANLHASEDERFAEEEVRLAADRAVEWSDGAPLILGGDFNLRPARTAVFAEIEARYALRAPTRSEAIDHILARGLDPVEPPRQWPPAARELRLDGRAVRLSDHAPVEAVFAVAQDPLR